MAGLVTDCGIRRNPAGTSQNQAPTAGGLGDPRLDVLLHILGQPHPEALET